MQTSFVRVKRTKPARATLTLVGLSALTTTLASALAIPVASAQTTTIAKQATAPKTGKVVVYVISQAYSQQGTTKQLVDRFVAAGKAKKWDIKLIDTKGDEARVTSEMRAAALKKPSAIVIGMGNAARLASGIGGARQAGVAVFGLDAGYAEGMTANITTDNKVLGDQGAQAMVKAINGKGSVMMFTFDDFEPIKLRGQAGQALLNAKGVKVLEYKRVDALTTEAAGGLASAKTEAAAVLAAFPPGQIQGIWCAWDKCAQGAYEAVTEAGRTDVSVTGIDGQPFAIAAIKARGAWKATVRQDWSAMAAKAAQLIEQTHVSGRSPQNGVVFVPGLIIDSTNVGKL
jgi:ribose transport system substrate-binding protein